MNYLEKVEKLKHVYPNNYSLFLEFDKSTVTKAGVILTNTTESKIYHRVLKIGHQVDLSKYKFSNGEVAPLKVGDYVVLDNVQLPTLTLEGVDVAIVSCTFVIGIKDNDDEMVSKRTS